MTNGINNWRQNDRLLLSDLLSCRRGGVGGGGGGRCNSSRQHPFLQQASGQIFKDDVNGVSSTSDTCYMEERRDRLRQYPVPYREERGGEGGRNGDIEEEETEA